MKRKPKLSKADRKVIDRTPRSFGSTEFKGVNERGVPVYRYIPPKEK